jgi:hypothetical protein
MSQTIVELVLKANTTMSLNNKMAWYSKVYPKSKYDTKFGIPFSTKDGMSAVKVTRLNIE